MSRTRSGLVSWDWEGIWWWRVLCLCHRGAPRGGEWCWRRVPAVQSVAAGAYENHSQAWNCMRLHQLLRESLPSLGLHAATSNSMEAACSCNETPDSIGTMEEKHLTRATRHVCGAAPCLGVADVAGSVIGHAGDVACAQTKTFAQRSREPSHTQQLESAPGLDKGSQDRDNTHTGACMRAPPCLQACVSGNPLTHAGFHAVARLGVVVSCGGIRAAHTGARASGQSVTHNTRAVAVCPRAKLTHAKLTLPTARKPAWSEGALTVEVVRLTLAALDTLAADVGQLGACGTRPCQG